MHDELGDVSSREHVNRDADQKLSLAAGVRRGFSLLVVFREKKKVYTHRRNIYTCIKHGARPFGRLFFISVLFCLLCPVCRYEQLYTPHVANLKLWKTSGHFDFYKEGMFDQMDVEGDQYQIKPMNCPFHCLVYKDDLRSYR